MLRSLIVLSLIFLTSATAHASFIMSGPEKAKTTAEIIAAAEKDDIQGGLRKEPYVSTAEFHNHFRKAFVAWYDPYSGEAACHVYIYIRDDKKGVWVRKVATMFRGTQDVSVEFGDAIIFRDVKGKVISRYPAE